LLAAVCALALAAPVPASPAPDFELPTADGSRFERLAGRRAGPTLVSFWSVDCPHCIAEFGAIRSFAREQPQWRVLMVNTDAATRLRSYVGLAAVPGTVLRVPGEVRPLMRRFGNAEGALPFAMALTAEGSVCAREFGELDAARLGRIVRACTQGATP
jgi:thiol-disulfide isomerase/thioredoxin